MHAAIRHEVTARQQEQVVAFARDVESSGPHAAIENAIRAVTDHGRIGRADALDAKPLIRRLGQGNRREAAGAVLQELQGHYHRNADGGLPAKDIAANFSKNVANGAYLDAAEITRALVEANHHYISANELNKGGGRLNPGSEARHPEHAASSSGAARHYDERSRDPRGR